MAIMRMRGMVTWMVRASKAQARPKKKSLLWAMMTGRNRRKEPLF